MILYLFVHSWVFYQIWLNKPYTSIIPCKINFILLKDTTCKRTTIFIIFYLQLCPNGVIEFPCSAACYRFCLPSAAPFRHMNTQCSAGFRIVGTLAAESSPCITILYTCSMIIICVICENRDLEN